MNSKLSLVFALLIAFGASVLVLNAYDPGSGIISDEDAAVQIAKHFIMNAPTYSYDGIDGSILFIQTTCLESWPVQYVVKLSFMSSHTGYGDRSNEMLAQVVTTHIAWVKVVNGEVVQAVLDEVWDELEQKEIGKDNDVDNKTIISPENAVNRVIDFIARRHELNEIVCFMRWEVEDLTPERMVGSSTQRFTGAGWTITVSWQVVQFPIYNVEAEYDSTIAFRWEGSLDHLGNIEEISYKLVK
jgi:hypothetical protein